MAEEQLRGLSPLPAQGSEGPWAWGRAPQRGQGLCRAQLELYKYLSWVTVAHWHCPAR